MNKVLIKLALIAVFCYMAEFISMISYNLKMQKDSMSGFYVSMVLIAFGLLWICEKAYALYSLKKQLQQKHLKT